jgi:hypothetical protein
MEAYEEHMKQDEGWELPPAVLRDGFQFAAWLSYPIVDFEPIFSQPVRVRVTDAQQDLASVEIPAWMKRCVFFSRTLVQMLVQDERLIADAVRAQMQKMQNGDKAVGRVSFVLERTASNQLQLWAIYAVPDDVKIDVAKHWRSHMFGPYCARV